MAFTVSNLANSVFGNKSVRFLRVTADAASDAIDTGFSVVEAVLGQCPQSMATAAIKVKLNQLTAATASNGKVAMTGAASGDIFHLTVIGR